MNASRLIEANIRAHTVDGYTAHHMVAAAHEQTIRTLAAELAELRGEGQKPQEGGHITTMTFGNAEVLVEYEFINATGHDAQCNVLNVFLNGYWCDPQDVVPAETLKRWAESLSAECAEAE